MGRALLGKGRNGKGVLFVSIHARPLGRALRRGCPFVAKLKLVSIHARPLGRALRIDAAKFAMA
ncbi:protein of unknown function [Trichlorobacter ammonificans]|uniref:Uncharacterized protein n=1 Tax=Trichlorobacter ammonificans TaxID=2916410 RepID=A0ABM9D7L7_9BACT|nr:protein of unknown function [Trichlorobacter ammonificans]